MSPETSSQFPYSRIMSVLNVGAVIVKVVVPPEAFLPELTLRKYALAE